DGAWAAGTTRTLEEAADDALRLLDRATTEAAPQGTVRGPGRERPQPRRPVGISPATGDGDARPMGDAARRTCLRTRGGADGWKNAGGRPAAGEMAPGAFPGRLGRAAPGPRVHRPPPRPDLAAAVGHLRARRR